MAVYYKIVDCLYISRLIIVQSSMATDTNMSKIISHSNTTRQYWQIKMTNEGRKNFPPSQKRCCNCSTALYKTATTIIYCLTQN